VRVRVGAQVLLVGTVRLDEEGRNEWMARLRCPSCLVWRSAERNGVEQCGMEKRGEERRRSGW